MLDRVAIAYLIGRIVVAFVLLPRSYRGEMTTADAYFGLRFGRGMQGTASVAFLFTRLLADGVRLFAAAIPMKVILDAYGIEMSFFAIIAILGLVTVAYTFVGGIRAVVWVDVLLAGIMASAMSTLSSSLSALSALSSSTMSDLSQKFSNRTLTDEQGLRLGRIFTACAVTTMARPFLVQPDLVGFTWYTAIGVVITLVVGTLLSRRHGEDSPLADRTADEETWLSTGGEVR